ncbi:hypothetical protein HSBAA_15630 [Vreelandella sulfidaeris]|uniref:Sulfatase N-terminal domain-containing protein n=1 Tax=Vreelandella sulfidaeris TaxID=115553 RepID=A0A455U3S5_9GAMM|nr:hypothetical protein HSBAA_15630 [Halomonas sulfidaeris]
MWQDIERIRDHYAWSVDYAVKVTGRWAERVADDNTLMIVLGDHQAAPLITGDDASAAVPVHIISGDRALLAPLSKAWLCARHVACARRSKRCAPHEPTAPLAAG